MPSKTREILPIPAILEPDGKICFCINLPDDSQHQAAFWGALSALGKRYSWGKPLTADSETVAAFWRELIAQNYECFRSSQLMTNKGCGDETPIGRRLTSNGRVQEQFVQDGPWTDIADDPRFNGGFFPPLIGPDGDDKKCAAATQAQAVLKQVTDDVLANETIWGTVLTLITFLATALSVFGIVGEIVAFVLAALAWVIISVGRTAITAALDADVWQRFKCNLYCHILDDGSFDESHWLGVAQRVEVDESGAAEQWLSFLLTVLGPVGLTNAARTDPLAPAGDCSACECNEPCDEYLLIFGTVISDEDGVIVIESENDPAIGNQNVTIRFGTDGEGCCYLSEYEESEFIISSDWVDCDGVHVFNPINVTGQCWRQIAKATEVGGGGFTLTITRFAC